ncbi:MAG: hypothetical protein WC683_01120 [bacterium]
MTRPRVLEQGGRNPTEQEHRVARVMRGHRNRGSGASMYAKGDVRAEDFLTECKRTEHASLYVKKAWLDKIAREAAAAGKEPALAIEIAGGPNDAHGERDWIMIPLRCWRQLTGESE